MWKSAKQSTYLDQAETSPSNEDHRRRRSRPWWLYAAFLLLLLQVLPYLSRRWVTDESWYAGPAYSISQGLGVRDPAIGPNDLENRFDARPPGTALVIAAFFRLWGPTQVAARLGSVLAALAVVFLVFQLTRDVLGETGALVATFLTATDNLIVLTARTARPEALTTMAVLLALLAMKQYWRSTSGWWAWLSGTLLAVGTMFHITLLGYIVSLGLLTIAVDVRRRASPPWGPILYAVGYLGGLVPFAAWILTAPLGKLGFRAEYLSRAANDSLVTKLLHEGHRYSDLLGFNVFHSHGLAEFPVRFPIPFFFLVCSYLLWKFSRTWFYLELILLLPSVLWLIYTVNKSSRYIALLAPLFGMVVGAAVAATRQRPALHRSVLTLSCAVILLQAAANAVLLNGARHADYDKVATELRSVIPQSGVVYGTITFWLAFHDREYISYERTDPDMAVRNFNARYFILGDRTMSNGETWDRDFYTLLNQRLTDLTSRSSLIGHFPDPYYGDLKVYKLPNEIAADPLPAPPPYTRGP